MYLNCFLLIGEVILELLGPGPKQLGHYELKSKDYPGSTMLAGEYGQTRFFGFDFFYIHFVIGSSNKTSCQISAK